MTNPKYMNNLGKFFTTWNMRKTDTAVSLAFNQTYKLSFFKLRKIVISFVFGTERSNV